MNGDYTKESDSERLNHRNFSAQKTQEVRRQLTLYFLRDALCPLWLRILRHASLAQNALEFRETCVKLSPEGRTNHANSKYPKWPCRTANHSGLRTPGAPFF